MSDGSSRGDKSSPNPSIYDSSDDEFVPMKKGESSAAAAVAKGSEDDDDEIPLRPAGRRRTSFGKKLASAVVAKTPAAAAAAAAPVVPAYEPPEGHWVRRFNKTPLNTWESEVIMEADCVLSLKDIVELCEQLGHNIIQPCFFSCNLTCSRLTIAQLNGIKRYLIDRGVRVPGKASPKQALLDGIDSLVFPESHAKRERERAELDQRLRKEMEERALKEGRIAIKEKGKWGLKCIFNSKCKSIDVGTGYCNIHYRENEKAMQKTEMLAIATRTSRTAVLGDDGLHYTLKCTDASCNLGVPYFNHSVASNAPKLCQTHQKEEDRKQHLKTQKESMVALATQKPGRTAVLYKNVQGLDFWSLNCTKEGCDLGVGEYINSWRCPAFCHTHQAEENRRMELQRQKSVVDSIVSRLSTGRKAVLMKPANSENEYWTLACQKEGCEAGVGRNLSTYDIPSHCIPHKIEASLARRKVELDQRAKNEGRTVISTKDGDWVLKCIKDECNEPEYGDTKRCSKHYSSEKFQVAEEKMSDVLTKAFNAFPSMFKSHRPVSLIKAWTLSVYGVSRNEAFVDNLTGEELRRLKNATSALKSDHQNLSVWMMIYAKNYGRLLSDHSIRDTVCLNSVINGKTPNTPLLYYDPKYFVDLTGIWPTDVGQSIQLNLHPNCAHNVFGGSEAYIVFVLVEALSALNIIPQVYSQTLSIVQAEIKTLTATADKLSGVASSSTITTSTAAASDSVNNTAKSSSSSSSSSSNTLQPELPVYLASFWREAKVDIEQAKTDLKQLFTIKMQLKKRIEAAALGNGGAGDDDIECGDQEVNFSCPLSLCRITHPARGKNCKHFQCFDLETFVACGGTTQTCPLCKLQLSGPDLIIDLHFLYLLTTYPNSSKCILHPDGSDSPFFEVENHDDDDDDSDWGDDRMRVAGPSSSSSSSSAAKKRSVEEVIIISDSEDEEDAARPAASSSSASRPPPSKASRKYELPDVIIID